MILHRLHLCMLILVLLRAHQDLLSEFRIRVYEFVDLMGQLLRIHVFTRGA